MLAQLRPLFTRVISVVIALAWYILNGTAFVEFASRVTIYRTLSEVGGTRRDHERPNKHCKTQQENLDAVRLLFGCYFKFFVEPVKNNSATCNFSESKHALETAVITIFTLLLDYEQYVQKQINKRTELL